MMNAEILKAALLGTDNYMPEIPEGAPLVFNRINALPASKEDRLLKLAFTSILYEEAGAKPSEMEALVPECPQEMQPLMAAPLTRLLQTALNDGNEVLLGYLVFKIAQRGEVIQARFVPTILDKALQNKRERQKLMAICGVTGAWLCRLNAAWEPLLDKADEGPDVWETGDLESRKSWFSRLRATEPTAAAELLERTFPEENANNRLAFLLLMQEGISVADEPFLQKLLTDKSQKVREAAIAMLRKIPGSAIQRLYMEWALRLIRVREETRLLVTRKKTVAFVDDVLPDEAVFKTGIEKVSKEKGVQDHVFWAGQLLSFIDPAALSSKLGISDQELIVLLLQHPAAPPLLPYLTNAAITFRNKAWALALLHRGDARDIGLLDALEGNEKLPFYLPFLNGNAQNLFNYLLDDNYTILPPRLAEQLLDHLSKFPYHINQPVYQRLALHLPAATMPVLQKYANDPRQDYQLRYFKNQASEMMRLLELRTKIP